MAGEVTRHFREAAWIVRVVAAQRRPCRSASAWLAGGCGWRELFGSVDDGPGQFGQLPVVAAGPGTQQGEGVGHVQV
jgi:hypothetical protein